MATDTPLMKKTIRDRARKDLLRAFFYIGIGAIVMTIIYFTFVI